MTVGLIGDDYIVEMSMNQVVPQSEPIGLKETRDSDRSNTSTLTRSSPKDQIFPERGVLLCKACGKVITHEKQRIAIQGAHRHTFANPHGLVFEIGVFLHAPGCGYQGDLTPEFSWFSGYQWKIAVCSGCQAHLGWLFVAESSRFNGLILNRLVQNIH